MFFDEAGARLSDTNSFVNYVRPDEAFVERGFLFDGGADAASCEVVEVERIAAESPDDVGEVTCEVVGTNVLDDIDVDVSATNGSSQRSDYSIEVALVRDEVRIGTASAFVENVEPGQTAPSGAFTTVDGPAEGVSCTVVHVSRTASS